MKRSYSVFVDDKYFLDFIALYNSWEYYENKVPIKVYCDGRLSEANKNKISKKVKVIDVNIEHYSQHHFYGKYLFKWIGMSRYMDDYEILLDADCIFLSNMDHLFEKLEQGYLVGAREEVDIIHKSYCNPEEWDQEHARIVNDLIPFIGDKAYNLTKEHITLTYNAGLFGLSRKKHKFLLDKSIEILTSGFDAKTNPISHLEQFNMNFLIDMYNIDVFVLPQLEWMNTWGWHKHPKKVIKIVDGKITLHNEGGNRINFYHFTGDVGVDSEDGTVKTCKMHHMVGDSLSYEPKLSRKDVEDLWYKRHESPVPLLYEFFFNRDSTMR